MKFAALLMALLIAGCNADDRPAANAESTKDERIETLERKKRSVEKFFSPMTVKDGDWLDTQKEAGETFEEYVASDPTLPTAERRTIYIQPIGTFTQDQQRAISLTADYMRAFYNLPVKLNAAKPLGNVPKDKQRRIEYRNNLQVKTQYFLDDVLPKMLPKDAAALIAFTNYDLYPGDTWSFVFGQATFSERVSVWSLYQFSRPGQKTDFNQFLDRTLKVAMHETGHMFSMKHCTKYECLMSGTNHLAETDRRPLDNCPECMAKLAWAMKYDPVERYQKLSAFWTKNGRQDQARLMTNKATAVSGVK